MLLYIWDQRIPSYRIFINFTNNAANLQFSLHKSEKHLIYTQSYRFPDPDKYRLYKHSWLSCDQAVLRICRIIFINSRASPYNAKVWCMGIFQSHTLHRKPVIIADFNRSISSCFFSIPSLHKHESLYHRIDYPNQSVHPAQKIWHDSKQVSMSWSH